GLSQSTVKRGIAELTHFGWITRKSRGHRQSNEYTLCIHSKTVTPTREEAEEFSKTQAKEFEMADRKTDTTDKMLKLVETKNYMATENPRAVVSQSDFPPRLMPHDYRFDTTESNHGLLDDEFQGHEFTENGY